MADIVTNHAMNDDNKNMSTLNIYCGILSTCHNNHYRWLNSLSGSLSLYVFMSLWSCWKSPCHAFTSPSCSLREKSSLPVFWKHGEPCQDILRNRKERIVYHINIILIFKTDFIDSNHITKITWKTGIWWLVIVPFSVTTSLTITLQNNYCMYI